MSTDFLLAGKAVVAMSQTTVPVAVVVRFPATHMCGRNVGGQRIAGGEALSTVLPMADMGVRLGAVVLGRRRQRTRGGGRLTRVLVLGRHRGHCVVHVLGCLERVLVRVRRLLMNMMLLVNVMRPWEDKGFLRNAPKVGRGRAQRESEVVLK